MPPPCSSNCSRSPCRATQPATASYEPIHLARRFLVLLEAFIFSWRLRGCCIGAVSWLLAFVIRVKSDLDFCYIYVLHHQ